MFRIDMKWKKFSEKLPRHFSKILVKLDSSIRLALFINVKITKEYDGGKDCILERYVYLYGLPDVGLFCEIYKIYESDWNWEKIEWISFNDLEVLKMVLEKEEETL